MRKWKRIERWPRLHHIACACGVCTQMQACWQEEGGKDKEDNAAITVRWRRVGRKEESLAFLRVPRLHPVVVGTLQPPLPVPFKKAPACLPLPADSRCLIYTAVHLTL